jgi:hypothetical protein
MKAYLWLAAAGLMAVTSARFVVADEPAKAAAPAAKADDFTFSGPFTHENLSIFLIHGKDAMAGKKFLTLQEALEQKKIVVHETKNVNQLAVENVSDDVEVFIQSGDIVKGGQQDRVLGYDLIVSAKSGKVPIQSFCVEQGRWSKRGAEDASTFSANPGHANSKELKLAINLSRQQDAVWAKVKQAQTKLSQQVGQSVESKDSPSSLQLTLEDKKLMENLDRYVAALAKIGEGKKDVIGYAVAINGKIEGVDIYGSAELFGKVWAKLLKGIAVDALAEVAKDKKFTAATADSIKTFLADAAKASKETKKDVSKRVQVNTKEAEKNVLIETCDLENGGLVIRRNYVAK